MPLVYVHGVNTRRGTTLEEQGVFDKRVSFLREQFRNTAFSERVSAPDGLRVFTPYWGDLGVKFARNLACLPQSGVQALAIGQPPENTALLEATAARLDPQVLQQAGLQTAPLLTLARTRSLAAAVDLLFAGATNAPLPGILMDDQAVGRMLPDAARLAAAAERYAGTDPRPVWLAEVSDDETFLTRLLTEISASSAVSSGTPAGGPAAPGIQALGLGSDLKSWLDNAVAEVKNAVGAVADSLRTTVTGAATQGARDAFLAISGYIRPAASALLGRFVGDVFTYLENRQPIADLVLADVDRAAAARREGDSELFLIGHSFGGIILYDVLTHFRPDLVCDLYVTVGSQVALFAEIDRLADHAGVAAGFANGGSLPRPQNAKLWLNVFDSTDFVGFGTRGVFKGALDFRFETDALPLVSHGAYFDTPRFFARLRERVREAFARGTDIP